MAIDILRNLLALQNRHFDYRFVTQETRHDLESLAWLAWYALCQRLNRWRGQEYNPAFVRGIDTYGFYARRLVHCRGNMVELTNLKHLELEPHAEIRLKTGLLSLVECQNFGVVSLKLKSGSGTDNAETRQPMTCEGMRQRLLKFLDPQAEKCSAQ